MFSDYKEKPIYIKTKELYKLCIQATKKHKMPYSLKDQFERSCLSILLNFVEGYGRFHKKDKKQFYLISRGSLNEVIACFDLIRFHGDLSEEESSRFNCLTDQIAKMLSGLINSQK